MQLDIDNSSQGDSSEDENPLRSSKAHRHGHGGQQLKFAANAQTWASEFPFPTFRSKGHKPSGTSMDSRGDDDVSDDELDDVENGRDSESSDDENINIVPPHRLASDWAFEHHKKSWRDQINESMIPSKSLDLSINGAGGGSTRRRSIHNALSASVQEAPPVPLPSREEAAALITVATAGSSALSGRLNTELTDLSWIARNQRQPACHLHLGNLHLRIDDLDEEERRGGKKLTLINSPRSCLVLLRKGVGLQCLLRRPWAKKRFNHTASFGALDTLSIEERKEYALEKLRQSRMQDIAAEYRALISVVEMEDVIQQCGEVIRSKKLLGELKRSSRPSSSFLRTANHSTVPEQLATLSRERPASALSQLQGILECRKEVCTRVTSTGEAASHLATKIRSLANKSRETWTAIEEKERRAADNLRRLEEERKERRTLRGGKDELYHIQNLAASGAHAYRTLLFEERTKLRSNEAMRYKEAVKTTLLELSDARRRQRIVEDVSHDALLRSIEAERKLFGRRSE